ncbi:MAG: hypothetical protein ERJ67_07720 [Aphanocapsa feldmannii 277cV]|uniref:Uncharacterized protein n=1 Tax=Aphanocapsa feldmannii 277cV TaxID=2507553 RepID=A0A524RMG5_9CHRO|nr:MAG: hypothetical protein ERJ67_07720 [Aphanocapsa feldmannii 277cV]
MILFSAGKLEDLINGCKIDIKDEVENWTRDRILKTSEADLIAYLVKKYTLEPPRIFRDRKVIDMEEEGISHNTHGSYLRIAIPFEGSKDLFQYKPKKYTFDPPQGRILDSTIQISYGTNLDSEQTPEEISEQISKNINSDIDRIECWLEWVKKDCDDWNSDVQEMTRQHIHERKQRILKHENILSSINLPLKRHSDTVSCIEVPVTRKKRPVAPPPIPEGDFSPELILEDKEYNYILTVINRLSLSIERSPSVFTKMEEEWIRDIILVNLNGHYEGNATGETFNNIGKTDILIRENEKNVFIAECKFWKGEKGLLDTIDQLLGYLTWRDTKAALILFSKKKNFTNVLAKIAEGVPKHGNFKEELGKIKDTHIRYLFKQKNDPDKDLYLAVLAFNIPDTTSE